MKEKSLTKNYIYNLTLTSINIIFPLITSPYLSYILGVENIGKVNYSTSIINWFILFSSFGIPRYGIREIARKRESKKELNITFWNLIIIQFIFTIISSFVYIILVLNSSLINDWKLYFIMLFMLVLNIFSIDWFYQGIEEYEYITKRNICIKVLSLILIFLMVRNRDNYLIYASINVFAMCFNNVLNYLHAKEYINIKIFKNRIYFYLKELRLYFFTTLIVASYNQLDQVMIGTLSEKDLAYYLRSKMVLSVGINITNSIVTVLVPRVSYLIEKNYNEYNLILQDSLNYIYILALPCTAGIYMLSEQLMVLLGGNEFLPAAGSLRIISIIIPIASIGNWQINQILLSHRQEKISFIIQFIASLFSIIVNIILIPKLFYIGAAITWVLTEILLVLMEHIAIKRYCNGINIKYLNESFLKYLVATVLMILEIYILKNYFHSNIIIIIVSILLGSITYFVILFLTKEKILLQILKKYKLIKV